MFATKWDVLFARVLVGIDRSTGVFSGREVTPGQQMVAVWTTTEIAEEALHVESWELRPITVRELLRVIPDGIGVVIDPEHQTGMTASPSYVANLKRYVEVFPVGAAVRLAGWDDMPTAVRAALAQEVGAGDVLSELLAFSYTLDDSPRLGCLAFAEAPDTDARAARSRLEAVLDSATPPVAPGLAAVTVVPLAEIPDEVRAALGSTYAIGLQRPSRLRWR